LLSFFWWHFSNHSLPVPLTHRSHFEDVIYWLSFFCWGLTRYMLHSHSTLLLFGLFSFAADTNSSYIAHSTTDSTRHSTTDSTKT
jgi:hypothetical protein